MSESSPNTDPQLLLESGPMQLKDFNPKGVLRFAGRKCMNLSCGLEIMDHWLRPGGDGEYWCQREGGQYSLGITGGTVDIPEGFGQNSLQC